MTNPIYGNEMSLLAYVICKLIGDTSIMGLFIWRGRKRGWSWLKSIGVAAIVPIHFWLTVCVYWLLVLRAKRKAAVSPAEGGL
jgi:hypothetical protein